MILFPSFSSLFFFFFFKKKIFGVVKKSAWICSQDSDIRNHWIAEFCKWQCAVHVLYFYEQSHRLVDLWN